MDYNGHIKNCHSRMSYEDFIKNFDQVQMSHIEPDMVGMNLAADAVLFSNTFNYFLNVSVTLLMVKVDT